MERTIHQAADLTRQMFAYSGKGRFVVQSMTSTGWWGDDPAAVDFDQQEGDPALRPGPGAPGCRSRRRAGPAGDHEPRHQRLGGHRGSGRHHHHQPPELRELDQQTLDSLLEGQHLQPGRFVILSIADTGCGMSAETIARIFDPFFTTKTSGRGLGLSAMLGILRGHGAGLKIFSELGKGHVLQVYFKASEVALPVEEAPEKGYRAPSVCWWMMKRTCVEASPPCWSTSASR